MDTYRSQLPMGEIDPRLIDDDAPERLRQEFIALVFDTIKAAPQDSQTDVRRIVARNLHITKSGQMHGGFRIAAHLGIRVLEWPQFYDFVATLWSDIPIELRDGYLAHVNRLLANHHVVWRLQPDGQFRRRLSATLQRQVDAAFSVLSQSRFAIASASFYDAMRGYHHRPRREREVCRDMLDVAEAVAREVYGEPSKSLSDILCNAIMAEPAPGKRRTAVLQRLRSIVDQAPSRGVGSAGVPEFVEIDDMFQSCLAGILLLADLKPRL